MLSIVVRVCFFLVPLVLFAVVAILQLFLTTDLRDSKICTGITAVLKLVGGKAQGQRLNRADEVSIFRCLI